MKVAGTEINIKHKSFEIYISGCKGPHCEGCHNPELYSFDRGVDFDPELQEKLAQKLKDLYNAKLCNFVWILGGEPLDSDLKDLVSLCKLLKQAEPNIKIVLFTHYQEWPEVLNPYLNYVKIGAYNKNGKSYVEPVLQIELANEEQQVIYVG